MSNEQLCITSWLILYTKLIDIIDELTTFESNKENEC